MAATWRRNNKPRLTMLSAHEAGGSPGGFQTQLLSMAGLKELPVCSRRSFAVFREIFADSTQLNPKHSETPQMHKGWKVFCVMLLAFSVMVLARLLKHQAGRYQV